MSVECLRLQYQRPPKAICFSPFLPFFLLSSRLLFFFHLKPNQSAFFFLFFFSKKSLQELGAGRFFDSPQIFFLFYFSTLTAGRRLKVFKKGSFFFFLFTLFSFLVASFFLSWLGLLGCRSRGFAEGF